MPESKTMFSSRSPAHDHWGGMGAVGRSASVRVRDINWTCFWWFRSVTETFVIIFHRRFDYPFSMECIKIGLIVSSGGLVRWVFVFVQFTQGYLFLGKQRGHSVVSHIWSQLTIGNGQYGVSWMENLRQFRWFIKHIIMHGTGFSSVSHSCGTLPRLIPIGSELHMLEIELYGTLFGKASWNLLLDLSNKSASAFNSYYIKFISRKKVFIKCPTAMRTPGKPCKEKDVMWARIIILK